MLDLPGIWELFLLMESVATVRPKDSEIDQAIADAATNPPPDVSEDLEDDDMTPQTVPLKGGPSCSAWEPGDVTTSRTPGRGGVPHYDDLLTRDPHAAPRVYPAWLPGETLVVSGSLFAGPGNSRRERREWAVARYGAVLEEMRIQGKWCFRVPVLGPNGDKHRPRKLRAKE
jgi:hypothetical protein